MVWGARGSPLPVPAQAAHSALPPQRAGLLPRCPAVPLCPVWQFPAAAAAAAPRQAPAPHSAAVPSAPQWPFTRCLLIPAIKGTAELIKVYLAPRGPLHTDPLPSSLSPLPPSPPPPLLPMALLPFPAQTSTPAAWVLPAACSPGPPAPALQATATGSGSMSTWQPGSGSAAPSLIGS